VCLGYGAVNKRQEGTVPTGREVRETDYRSVIGTQYTLTDGAPSHRSPAAAVQPSRPHLQSRHPSAASVWPLAYPFPRNLRVTKRQAVKPAAAAAIPPTPRPAAGVVLGTWAGAGVQVAS